METNSINEDNQQEDENNDQALDTLKMKQMYLDQMQQQSNVNIMMIAALELGINKTIFLILDECCK